MVRVNIYRQCPYETCLKGYASDISLNLHIRLKHKNKSNDKQVQKSKEVDVSEREDYKRLDDISIAQIRTPQSHQEKYIKLIQKTKIEQLMRNS